MKLISEVFVVKRLFCYTRTMTKKRDLNVNEFVTRLSDDLSCFRIMWMREMSKRKEMFPYAQSFEDWIKHFLIYIEQEKRPREYKTLK